MPTEKDCLLSFGLRVQYLGATAGTRLFHLNPELLFAWSQRAPPNSNAAGGSGSLWYRFPRTRKARFSESRTSTHQPPCGTLLLHRNPLEVGYVSIGKEGRAFRVSD